jgi:hypothetical protein
MTRVISIAGIIVSFGFLLAGLSALANGNEMSALEAVWLINWSIVEGLVFTLMAWAEGNERLVTIFHSQHGEPAHRRVRSRWMSAAIGRKQQPA